MEISSIRVFKVNGSVILGSGTIEFDEKVFIKFKIMNGKTGLFVSWPSTKGKDSEGDDKWYNDAGLVVKEEDFTWKNSVDEAIIKEYNKVVGMPSQDKKETSNKQEDTPAEEKKKPLVSFKKK